MDFVLSPLVCTGDVVVVVVDEGIIVDVDKERLGEGREFVGEGVDG